MFRAQIGYEIMAAKNRDKKICFAFSAIIGIYLYRGFESIPEYFLNKLKDRDEQNAK